MTKTILLFAFSGVYYLVSNDALVITFDEALTITYIVFMCNLFIVGLYLTVK